MSITDGFGKKGNQEAKQFIDLPEIGESMDKTHKHMCGNGEVGDLIKLETFTGPVYEKDGKRYYNIYWRVMCQECGEEAKQVCSTIEVSDEGIDGHNTLRWK